MVRGIKIEIGDMKPAIISEMVDFKKPEKDLRLRPILTLSVGGWFSCLFFSRGSGHIKATKQSKRASITALTKKRMYEFSGALRSIKLLSQGPIASPTKTIPCSVENIFAREPCGVQSDAYA
jgi:hypothetical protein